MNNVKSEDILCPCIPQPEPKREPARIRKKKLLAAMKPGKAYRPHHFGKMPLKPETIAAYLNQLNDEKKIERLLVKGLIYWRKPK